MNSTVDDVTGRLVLRHMPFFVLLKFSLSLALFVGSVAESQWHTSIFVHTQKL